MAETIDQTTTGPDLDYLKKVYGSLDGEGQGWDFDSFVSRMGADSIYSDKVFDRIGGKEKEWSYDSFATRTGLKKKDETGVSPTKDTSLDSEKEKKKAGLSDVSTSARGRNILSRLVADGLPDSVAAGIVGNIAMESGFDSSALEKKATKADVGRGWIQWTGPRRKAFEEWSKKKGLEADSSEANYGYLVHEMKTVKGIWGPRAGTPKEKQVRSYKEFIEKATTPELAAELFMLNYERPNEKVQHLDKRISKALDFYKLGVIPKDKIPSWGGKEVVTEKGDEKAMAATAEEYKKAMREPLTPSERVEIEEELTEEFEESGFKDTIGKYYNALKEKADESKGDEIAKWVFSKFGDYETYKEEAVGKAVEELKAEAERQGLGTEVEFSEDQITERAMAIRRNQLIKKKKEYNKVELLTELADPYRDVKSLFLIEGMGSISDMPLNISQQDSEKLEGLKKRNKEQQKKLPTDIRVDEANLAMMSQNLNEMSAAFSKDEEALEAMPAGAEKNAAIDVRNENLRVVQDLAKDVQRLVNTINNNKQDLQSLEVEADLLKRNYDATTNSVGRLGASTASLGIGIWKTAKDITDMGLMVADYTIDGVSAGTGMELQGFKDFVENQQKESLKEEEDIDAATEYINTTIRGNLRKARTLDDLESFTDLAQWTGDLFADQIPQLAMIMATGGNAGLYLLAGSAYGNKLNDMEKEMAAGLADYDFWQLRGTAAMVGVGEFLSEKVTQGILKRAMGSPRMYGTLGKIDKGKLSADFKRAAAKNYKDKLAKAGILVADPISEGASEVFAQINENIADKFILGKDVSLWDGVPDAFVSGLFIGGGIKIAGGTMGLVMKDVTADKNKTISKNLEEIKEITDMVATLQQQEQTDITKLQIDIANTAIAQREIENGQMILGGLDVLNRLSADEIRKVSRLNDDVSKIRDEYRKISEATNTTEEQKAGLIEALQKQYNDVVTRKDALMKIGQSKDSRYIINNKEVTAEEMKTFLESEENISKVAEGESSIKIFNDNALEKDFAKKMKAKAPVAEEVVEEKAVEEAPAEEVDVTEEVVEEVAPVEEKTTEEQVREEVDAFIDEQVAETYEQAFPKTEALDKYVKPKSKFNTASQKANKKEKINEKEMASAIEEGYDTLDKIDKDTSLSDNEKDILSELIEDQIENLESYELITETKTRKVAKEVTVQVPKKTKRKTAAEKEFVGKKAVYSDMEGKGGTGTITLVERPDGKEYYVLEGSKADVLGAKPVASLVLGERGKTFQNATINYNENNDPVSITTQEEGGKQITIKDPAIAQQFFIEQTKQEDFDTEFFEETYIEFTGEEKVEVLKTPTKKPTPKAKAPAPKAEAPTKKAEPKKEAAPKKKDGPKKVIKFRAKEILSDQERMDAIVKHKKETSQKILDEKRPPQGGFLRGARRLFGKAKTKVRVMPEEIYTFVEAELTPALKRLTPKQSGTQQGKTVVGFTGQQLIRAGLAQKASAKQLRDLRTPGKADQQLRVAPKTIKGVPPKQVEALIDRLQKAFPNTTFFTNKKAWDAMMADPQVEAQMNTYLKGDEVVYGMTVNGEIFLNPDLMDLNTPIHEIGHIWLNLIKDTNPELYAKGLELVEGTKEFKDSKDRLGDTAEAREEALAILIGNKGETIADTAQKNNFKDWLNEMWESIKNVFPSLRKLSPSQIQNLSLDSFVGGVVKDIMAGKPIEGKAKRTAKDIVKELRQKIKDTKIKKDELIKSIREIDTTGKFTDTQVNAIVNRFDKTNALNPVMRERFLKYVENVYAKADYVAKLKKAESTRKKMRRKAKDKDKDAFLRQLATNFAQINPALVEDIDAYIEEAAKVMEGLRTSSVKGTEVNFRTAPKIIEVQNYINEQVERQQRIAAEESQRQLDEMLGEETTTLTEEQIDNKLAAKDKLVKDYIRKRFNSYVPLIESMINTNKDPFTGETLDLTDNQKKIMKDFININLDLLTIKEAKQVNDALNNFATNQSTAGLEAMGKRFVGAKNVFDLVKGGVKSYKLKLFFTNAIGQFLAKNFAQLGVVFEQVFRGRNIARKVMEKMGITDFINGVAKARFTARTIVETYAKMFEKTKPNGEAFNTAKNITERGLLAFMRRSTFNPEGQAEEFARRKKLIEQTIEYLTDTENATDIEQKKGKLYEEVYNKMLKDSDTIAEVEAKADATNLEAVEWWTEQWAQWYGELSEVSINVYNTILEQDLNYIPDSFVKKEIKEEKVDFMDSAFIGATRKVYDKKTGVLMAHQRTQNLPDNRYISLDFDSNNSRIIESALVDINTAAPTQQIQGFLNSPYFKKLIGNAVDRKLLENRIKGYIRRARRKDFEEITPDEKKFLEFTNAIAGLGVSRALGGIFQPIKQTLPVAANTLINAGTLDLNNVFSKAVNDFITNSGYAIANRGITSQTTLDNINRAIEEAATSKTQKTWRGIRNINEMWLKVFLVKPDVFIARASWMSYYKQALKKQGVDTSQIDWATHKVNTKAGNYAQQQVDVQQNVSDADLQGDFLASKNAWGQIARKVLIPFMNFVINQKQRMYSDMLVVTSKTASSEDKVTATRSLGGLATETVLFSTLSYYISNLMFEVAASLMDYDEPEEDKKKRQANIIKGRIGNIYTDLTSPLPQTDWIALGGMNMVLDLVQSDLPDEEKFKLFNMLDKNILQSLGVLGIPLQKGIELDAINEMAFKGTLTKTSIYGKKTTKILDYETQKNVKDVHPLVVLYNLGLLPTEMGNVAKYIIKIAGKKAKTEKQIEKAKESQEGTGRGRRSRPSRPSRGSRPSRPSRGRR